jgi:S-adenosylmethionine synthetase
LSEKILLVNKNIKSKDKTRKVLNKFVSQRKNINLRKKFTSESVMAGHPDKICDRISDAILDKILEHDKNARVACETMVSNNLVVLAGEITTNFCFDAEQIARDVIKSIGYDKQELGFCFDSCNIITCFNKQSSDIALGVNKKDIGAGDQGMMFGFACNETKEFMPTPIYLAHEITKIIDCTRKDISYLGPDGKAQVTVEYFCDKPIRIDNIIISVQHDINHDQEQIKKDMINRIISKVSMNNLIDENTKIFINPTGRFVVGGPIADSGLTGRKIIVDTYGGYARHGGGAFSGKDATKVDRCGAYMARYVAKNIVACGIADRCEIQIAYAIGLSEPVAIFIDTFNSIKQKNFTDSKLIRLVKQKFDFRPSAIIEKFDLLRPIYEQLANYGHFGRDELNLPWEKIDANLF